MRSRRSSAAASPELNVSSARPPPRRAGHLQTPEATIDHRSDQSFGRSQETRSPPSERWVPHGHGSARRPLAALAGRPRCISCRTQATNSQPHTPGDQLSATPTRPTLTDATKASVVSVRHGRLGRTPRSSSAPAPAPPRSSSAPAAPPTKASPAPTNRSGASSCASATTWPSRGSRRDATAWSPTTVGSPSAARGRRCRRSRSRRAP